MKAIFKREFLSYMHSVIGFLFMAVMIFFFGLYGTVYNLVSGYPYISYTLNAIIFLFLLMMPVLSMRILADERKQKTDQLILTAPITVGQIVVGKYLAMAAIFMIPVLGMCLFPLFLQQFGTVPLVESYVAILAFALYGLTCIAVGLFVSSITESQVIAAVISFGVLFLTYMMSGIESLISQTGNLVTKILSVFDFQIRFANTINGILDLNSIVYFVSVIVLLLFLTTQSIQKRRYSVSVKNFSMGAYSSMTVAIVCVIVVFVNLIVTKLPTKYTNIDVTANQLYTISEQSIELLEGLEEDVTIYVLTAEDSADTTVAQTLKNYEEYSDRVTVTYIDPLINPQFATQYGQSGMTQNSIIVETDKRYKVISYNDLYESEFDYSTYQQNVTGYDGEGMITSAIDYCISENMPKIYMIAGHNEYSLDDGFVDVIEKENIAYETISLLEYEEVPEDAECVIIHAPETDFSVDDKDKIIRYLNKGGKAIVTTEYSGANLPNFDALLAEFGLEMQPGYVVENDADYYYQIPTYLLPNIEVATETSGLTGNYSYVFVPFAQGIAISEEMEDVSYTKLLTGSEQSIVKTNVQTAQTYEKEEGDVDGPICVGVKAVKPMESSEATLYVFSSAQMFTDNADSVVSGNNKVLFSNIMGTIANHEVTVSVPVKSYEVESLMATSADANIFMLLCVVIIPFGLLITGVLVWNKRRKK